MTYKLTNIDDSLEYFKNWFTINKAEFYKTMLDTDEQNQTILRKTITSLEKEMFCNDFSNVEETFGEITAVQYYIHYIEKKLTIKTGVLFGLYEKYRSKKNNEKRTNPKTESQISREKNVPTTISSTILQVDSNITIPEPIVSNNIIPIENKVEEAISSMIVNKIETNGLIFENVDEEMNASIPCIRNCLAWKTDKIFENNTQFDSTQKPLVLKTNFEDTCKAYMSFLNSFNADFQSKIVLPTIGEMAKNEFPMYFYAWVKTNKEKIRKNLSQSLSLLFHQIDKKIIFINKYNLSLDDFLG